MRVAHSIPDSVALVIETAAGRVVHTGDWKLDHTPVDGLKTDVGKLAEIGNRGVDLLLGDSTNAERPGNTGSERLVGEAFRSIFPLRTGRILVASFASNIHRMQQAADVAVECGRKVVVVGRSMRKNLNIARNLGYVSLPEEDAIVNPDEAAQLPPDRVLVLCTGSQGEPMSALTRIAYGDHKALTIEPGDTVIISAKPVPGNELRVHDSINQLAARAPRCCTRRSRPCTSRVTHARRSCGRCSRSCGRGTSCRSTGSTGCSPRTPSSRARPASRRSGS